MRGNGIGPAVVQQAQIGIARLGLHQRILGHRLGETTVRLVAANRRGQGRLTVVDVTDGTDVDVRLGPLENFLGHYEYLSFWWAGPD